MYNRCVRTTRQQPGDSNDKWLHTPDASGTFPSLPAQLGTLPAGTGTSHPCGQDVECLIVVILSRSEVDNTLMAMIVLTYKRQPTGDET